MEMRNYVRGVRKLSLHTILKRALRIDDNNALYGIVSYAASNGVFYGDMDAFKAFCQQAVKKMTSPTCIDKLNRLLANHLRRERERVEREMKRQEEEEEFRNETYDYEDDYN